MIASQDAADLLSDQGPLVKALDGFAPRQPQQVMARAIQQAIANQETLVVEAGTGTGKTFAYLVPALLAGERVIVSTGTKHLQDQLFDRDLPLVRNALACGVDVALLKGRQNYLCLHRLQMTELEGRLSSREQVRQLQDIRAWSGRTQRGDIAELSVVAEDALIWPRVTSTTDNCLGTECSHYQDCFVVKARRRAQEAQLVVINHHLLFADLALKEQGFGELLPGAGVFIIDEAHQLAEAGTQFFGSSITSRQVQTLARDCITEHLAASGDMQSVPAEVNAMEKAIADLRIELGDTGQRVPWERWRTKSAVEETMGALEQALTGLNAWLEAAAPRSRGLENCWLRARVLLQRVQTLRQSTPPGYVTWLETFKRSLALHMTPLDIADLFQEQAAMSESCWIFTSATLAVGDDFHYFTDQLGLSDAKTLQLASPFDYQRNALTYLPPRMPEPNSDEYLPAVIKVARRIIEASQGRAFLLFTSHRALQAAAEALRDQLDYPLLVQGDAPRFELLRRFRELGNAVLLGTGSFWEGVDVRGEALSMVLIDKLPFASPGDPVLQARIDFLREAGGNPFMDLQVPTAVIALKQGVGRLIRDVDDRGVLVLCDPRISSKPYGRIFKKSLPDAPLTQNIHEVEAFFAPAAALPDVEMQ